MRDAAGKTVHNCNIFQYSDEHFYLLPIFGHLVLYFKTTS